MKISQICAVALLLVAGSALAFADGINDPRVVIHGVNGNGPEGCEQCRGVGMNFNFTIPAHGNGSLFFTNTSGRNWTSLALIETGEPAADISCRQQFFTSCTTQTLKNGSVEILLSGIKHSLNADRGILNGDNFAIAFVCVNGCWINGGSVVTAHATSSTPEPETLALMGTGLVAIVARRKRWMERLKG